MMHLLIDCGNTRVKWALLDDKSLQLDNSIGKWLAQGALPHAQCAEMASQIAAQIRQQPEPQGQPACAPPQLGSVLIANVAGAAMRDEILRQLQQLPASEHATVTWFASSAHCAGVSNGYKTPGQLGCDRFAAVIGAHALLPGKNLLVANCGTATTIDAVSANGHFLGGMILPGLALMAQSLARNTAQLPQVQHAQQLPRSFADNTEDAIISGCLNAQCGAIEKTLRELEHRWAQPVHCVLSGGAAFALAPALSVAHQILDNLVLHGLHAVLRAQLSPTGSVC